MSPDLRDLRLTLSQRQLGPNNGGPVNFKNADLGGAEFRNASLTGANLQRADLVGADLVHARLDGADLSGADLTDAMLDYADLTGANLESAILVGASFANVRGLTQEQIAAAYGNASTVLPAPLLPPESWFPAFDDEVFEGFPAPNLITNNDPYDALGVEPTATQEEIRTAFRQLVKKYHPDLNPGDVEAQETFKRVSIAYRILSNPEKRSQYDRGEIDGEGEVDPEYEARRQFRRYAFRFYAAAAASLMIAIGAVGGVWYVFLTQDGADGSRLELAVAAPPKESERLSPMPLSPVPETRTTPIPAENILTAKRDAAQRRPSRSTVEAGVEEKKSQEPAAERVTSVDQKDDGPPSTVAEEQPVADAQDSGSQPAAKTDDIDIAENDVREPAPATEHLGGTSVTDTSRADVKTPEAASGSGRSKPLKTASNSATKPEQTPAALDEPDHSGASKSDANAARSIRTARLLPEDAQMGPPAPGAGNEALAPPGAPQAETKDPPRPLREEHRQDEARPAQADAAESGASGEKGREKEAELEKTSAQDGKTSANARSSESPQGQTVLHKKYSQRMGSDAISGFFWERAIRETLSGSTGQATASVDSLSPSEYVSGQDEVWDLYTHSTPQESETVARPWPDAFTAGKAAEVGVSAPRAAVPVRTKITEKAPARRAEPRPVLRKQAVSDILAGGL